MSAHNYRSIDVEVAGGVLHTAIWEPEGEPVDTILAIHGLTANHRAWVWLVDALPDWRVIAPDLRGRGGSNDVPGPFGMGVHADDMAAVIAAIGSGPVKVVGHSMGGFVALVLAHRYPELVRRLVLVDGGIPIKIPEGISPEQAARAVIGPAAERLSMEFPSVEAYLAFWQNHPAFAEIWSEKVAAYAMHDLEGEAPHLHSVTRFEAMVGDTEDFQTGTEALAALNNLSHPAHFLRAERGILNQPGGTFDPTWVAQWEEKLPNLTTSEVHDLNHYSIIMSAEGCRHVADAITAG